MRRCTQCDQEGSRCLIQPDGYRAQFRKLPGGGYAKAPGIDAMLVENRDGTFTLTWTRTGEQWHYGDDTWDYVDTITDANGNEIDFDATGDVLHRIFDTQGREIDVTQSRINDITRIEDETGRQWDYGYDGSRNLTSVTDPDEHVTQYAYDGSGLMTHITDARGNSVFVEYDDDWRVTEVRREVDGRSNDVITTYAYSGATSPCGASGDVGKTVVTNPRGRATTYCWNAKDQVTSVRDALGREQTQSFTDDRDHDQVVKYADTGSPATTDFDYNANEDITRTVEPSGEQKSIVYWSAGSNTRDPLRDHRVQSLTDANGMDQYFDYDDHGNLTSVKDDATTPRNQATLTYNADGTLASFTDGESHRTAFSYAADGNLREVTPPSVSSPGTLGTTQYTYDGLSRVESSTDGRGESLTYSYDGLDRITRVTAEDRSWIAYTYDANGNLLTREDSGSSVTRYTCDKLNRQTEEDLPGAAYNQYGYDKNGNVTSIVDQSGTVTYGYDDVDRVTSIVSPRPGGGTDTVSYSYTDPDARNASTVRTATLPGSATQRVERDLSGKITDVLLKDRSSAVLQQRTYGYLNGSTQTDLVQTMLDQAGNRTTYAYADRTENLGRLLKARIEDRSRALVTEYRYAYDKAGNRTTGDVETSRGTTTTTYAYNAADQLCWRYVGTSSNDCATAPRGATTFTYDAAGSQLTGDNTLTWDPYGRLASVDRTSLGFLSRTNDALSVFGTTALQDNALGFSRSDNGRTVTSIVRDPNTGAAVSQSDGTSKRWYTADNVGSTVALTDDTSAQARSFAYDPDGTSTTSGSGPAAAVGFAGGAAVGSTGLYHFGARFYDPRTARWTSQDPVAQYTDLGQANRYGYAAANPVNFTDPSGQCLFGLPCPIKLVLKVFYFPCMIYRSVLVRYQWVKRNGF